LEFNKGFFLKYWQPRVPFRKERIADDGIGTVGRLKLLTWKMLTLNKSVSGRSVEIRAVCALLTALFIFAQISDPCSHVPSSLEMCAPRLD
jgi:hypothetical protein